MANKMEIFTRGGEMIDNVEDLLKKVSSLVGENTELKLLNERQEAALTSMEDKVDTLSRKVDSLQDDLTANKETHYVGKRPEFLDEFLDEVKPLTHNEKRKLIYQGARNQKSGYNRIYGKVKEMTGVDVYQHGKLKISKFDQLGVIKPVPSFINTVFLKGVDSEAAAISLDMIRNQ